MCGHYFVPNHKVESVLDKAIRDRTTDIENLLENETNYFLLTIDFDYHGGNKGGEIYYRQLVIGSELDEKINWTLTRTE